jgi:hypothetical protein
MNKKEKNNGDYQIRLEALNIATRRANQKANFKDVIKDANECYNFLKENQIKGAK